MLKASRKIQASMKALMDEGQDMITLRFGRTGTVGLLVQGVQFRPPGPSPYMRLGDLTLGRVIGPKAVFDEFVARYGDVTNAAQNSFRLGTTPNLHVDTGVMTSIAWMQTGDMVIAEHVQFVISDYHYE